MNTLMTPTEEATIAYRLSAVVGAEQKLATVDLGGDVRLGSA
jgi:hypothetical protein